MSSTTSVVFVTFELPLVFIYFELPLPCIVMLAAIVPFCPANMGFFVECWATIALLVVTFLVIWTEAVGVGLAVDSSVF